MNRTLPPRDRGHRNGTSRGQSRCGGAVSGARGLVCRVEDPVERSRAIKELIDARRGLEMTLRTILRRDDENELNRLLLDMCEADQLERCEQLERGEVRWWQPTPDHQFGSRHFGIEDEIHASLAEMFCEGLLAFSVEVGPPPDVRWIVKKPLPGERETPPGWKSGGVN